MMRIHWEVDGASGSTEVKRRDLCNEIALLRKAGYTVTGVERVA